METTKQSDYWVGRPKADSSSSALLDDHPKINLLSVKAINFHYEDFNIAKPHNNKAYLTSWKHICYHGNDSRFF